MKLIKTIRKFKIYLTDSNHLCLDSGEVVDYPVIYENLTVAYDNPFALPKYVKEYVAKHASYLLDIKLTS